MPDALVTQLARALNLPPDAARHTLDHLVATLREQLDASGETRVPGLGTFRRDEEGLYFVPDDGLARAVNHRYAGLRPIEAGPASTRTEPEEEPEGDVVPEDPFAETPFGDAPSVEEEDAEEETAPEEEAAPEQEFAEPETDLPETTIGFQPLQSFIEPEEEGDEPEPEPSDALDEVDTGEPAPEPAVDAPVSGESPTVEPQPEEAPAFEEEFAPEEAPPVEEEPDEEVPSDTWAEEPETPEGEHVLGPLPPEEIEEAEYDLVEPEEPAAPRPPEVERDEAWIEGLATAEALDDDALSDEPDERDDAAEPPAPPPVEPSPVAEEPHPSPEAEPVAEPHAAAPAVADAAPADREPASSERRRGVPVFLTVVGIGLVLGVVALFWLLNREPEGPDLVERPAPADTSVVAAAPPPADTLASDPDTTTAAEAPPPEPDAPTPPADALRGTAGIDPAAGGFTWVVASEVDRAVAERRVAAYREQGLRAGVVAQEAGGRTRYRVSLGQFGSVAEAEARRSDLPPDVPSDSWILRL